MARPDELDLKPAGARGGGPGAAPAGPRPAECPRCGEGMLKVQACHMICPRCGAHLDCSDKGTFW